MKKKIFGAVVVVAIAVGGVINLNLNKVSNKGNLALANVEALAEESSSEKAGYSMDRVSKTVKVWGSSHVNLCPNIKTLTVAECGCNFHYESQYISCCISHFWIIWGTCDFQYQNKNC